MRIITTVIVFAYLLFQSWQDAKNMRVLVLPNNLVLAGSVAVYLWDVFSMGAAIPPEALSDVLIAIVLVVVGYFCKAYGSGDAKAMVSILLSLRYWYPNYPHPNAAAFFMVIFVTNVVFFLTYFIRNKLGNPIKTKTEGPKQKKKAAYFPALTAGYAFGVLLGALSI